MGSLSIINEEGLHNMLHIVLNNGLHESVGSHPTVAAPGTTFHVSEIAKAVGYEKVFSVNSAT
jgi:phosphonopyruvate decarboxylase